MRKTHKIGGTNIFLTVLLFLGCITVLFPLYMTVMIAFKNPSEMTNDVAGALSFPSSWSLSNFSEAMRVTNFWHSLGNSFLITAVTIVLAVLLHSMAGYAIGRNMNRKKGYKLVYFYIVSGMFVPFAILMMPLVKQTAMMGLDNRLGVIILYLVFYMPMNVMLYSGYLKNVPLAMEEAARVDMPISLHEEDPTLNEVNGVNKGVISDKMGIGGAPAISEDVMVARDVMLALETGAKVDIQHISSGRSVDLVRLAKKKGAKVYAEATPHHFTLTEEDVPNYGTMAKMNPPLRTEWDRTKIIEGLADGTIDMIATDHAPHAIEEKEREFTKAPSGIVGLETSLSLGITSLVKRGYLTMMQLLEKMTVNPARLYKFDCGTLEEGKAADIVIFAPDEVRTVESFESKAENSPFLGAQLYGKVKYTICDGKVVYRG